MFSLVIHPGFVQKQQSRSLHSSSVDPYSGFLPRREGVSSVLFDPFDI